MICTAYRTNVDVRDCPHDRRAWPEDFSPERQEHMQHCVLVDGRWVYVVSIARDECTRGHPHTHQHWDHEGAEWTDDSHGAVPHRDPTDQPVHPLDRLANADFDAGVAGGPGSARESVSATGRSTGDEDAR